MTTTQPRQPRGVPTGGQWRATARPEGPSLEARVHRSAGKMVAVGAIGAIVGGGYRGLTPDLDWVVAETSALMAQRFDCDVEIRYNSDRRRGGAWLVTHPGDDGFSNWIGISAELSLTQEEAEADPRLARAYRGLSDEWQHYLDSCDGKVHIEVYVSEEALRDRSLARPLYGQRLPRVFVREVPDVATAVDLVAEVSVAGDNEEIKRRRELQKAYGRELKKLEEKANARWAAAKHGLSKGKASKKLRRQMIDEYHKAKARLTERFWLEIDGAKP